MLEFRTDNDPAAPTLVVAPRDLVIAGWTGRDADAIEHHIVELEALGVPRPSAVPLYYRVSRTQLTQAAIVQVIGGDSSGEAEPLLFFADGTWWLSAGSDHTDRRVETYSVAVSKQMCVKPTARDAWRWSDVAPYQDELQLSSRILEDGRWVTYQQGTLASIRPLQSLVDGWLAGREPHDGTFVSCGTLVARPNAAGVAIRPAAEFEFEIHDPRRHRSIVHRYAIEALPVIA